MKLFTNETNAEFAVVRLGDVQANPFRHIDQYPIMPSKVTTLKNSMEDTGFWTNVIGRVVDGQIQIAYGHHRLAAALEAFGPDHLHTFPVEDYDDEMMLRIMAEENSDEWANAVEHGMMVTKAARDYLDAWLTENGDAALKSVQTYSGDFGLITDPVMTSESGKNTLDSEVAVFIRLASNKSGAEGDLLKAIERGVDQNHVALWLGKNYVTTANAGKSIQPSSVIRNGWNYIGMSPKRKAWVEKAEAVAAAAEAQAKAEADAAAAAQAKATEARRAAEAEEQRKREAEAEAKRKADAARKAEERAKGEAARKAAAEAKAKADAEAKAAAEARAKAAKDARAKALAETQAKAAAEAQAKAAEAAKAREAELTRGLNTMISNGLVDPEAIRLLPTTSLASTFMELMVDHGVGNHIPKDEQVDVIKAFAQSYPEGKSDQLQSFMLQIVKDSEAQSAILFALETELKQRFDKMLSAQTSTANAVAGFRELLDKIKAEGDIDKMRILSETLSVRQASLHKAVLFLRSQADRLESLIK